MGGAVLRAVPGYVLPTDLAGAALYVKPPAGATVVGAHADAPRAPSTAALTVSVGPSAGGGFERWTSRRWATARAASS